MSETASDGRSGQGTTEVELALRACFPEEWGDPWWIFWRLGTCYLTIPEIGGVLIRTYQPKELDHGYGDIQIRFMTEGHIYGVDGEITSYHQIEFPKYASLHELKEVKKTVKVYKEV